MGLSTNPLWIAAGVILLMFGLWLSLTGLFKKPETYVVTYKPQDIRARRKVSDLEIHVLAERFIDLDIHNRFNITFEEFVEQEINNGR